MKRKRKERDIIQPYWPVIIIVAILTLILCLIEIYWTPTTRPIGRPNIMKAYAVPVIALFAIRFDVLDKTGISCRWLFIYPYRKIKWEQVERMIIVPDDASFSILCILQGCPLPDFSKKESYNVHFCGAHPDHTYRCHSAKKHVHLFEKYWHGEIERKYLLYQKKK